MTKTIQKQMEEGSRIKQFGFAPYCVHDHVVGISTSLPIVLIDLSDTVVFPHQHNNKLVIKQIDTLYDLATAETWDLRIGILGEVDANNGTSIYFDFFKMTFAVNINQFIKRDWTAPGGGLDCELMLDDLLLKNFRGGVRNTADTDWQSDVAVGVAPGGTTLPETGDLIMKITEVTGATQLALDVWVWYDSE